ncbi:MAG: flagellar biosynthesis protein FlhA [Deltaproteobacteria bacterium]|nr:flagellar biosynthesis protein FlhA [Deltaproteobacteria bacterium]
MSALTERVSSYRIAEVALPIGLMGILATMIVPVPAILLDMLLAANIAAAVLILLVSMHVMKPVDFSVFPTIILITTLFRLSLNVASTRLILLHGSEGVSAAGHVIKSFGMFVVGGNYAVGMIVFAILVIINFVVITKGAGRIAEVSARFTLDAMPGKQMSIDADLNAGIIGEEEARTRRRLIAREADFYGAMDGASKFVRGDAVAAVLITFINILGGIVIGIFQQGMDIKDALSVYSILTIGDGLVAQVPALIISTAAGVIVTRAASESDMTKEFASQIFAYPRAVAGTAAVLFLLGLVPGLPHLAFLSLSLIMGGIAYMSYEGTHGAPAGTAKEEDKKAAAPPQEKEELKPPDQLSMEVGYRLIPLVDAAAGGELLERIKIMRKTFASDMGFLVPAIHVKDNLQFKPEEYVFLLRGNEAGRGVVMPNHYLAIDPGAAEKDLEGMPAKEPAFGLPALWIEEGLREKARLMGYTVVNPSVVIVTHLTEVIRANAHEIITRQDVQAILDGIAKTHPKVVEELVPSLLTVGGVQKVLQNLLRERVPVRDMLTIMETLADYAASLKDTDALSEHVRQALSRSITRQYSTEEGVLPVMIMDPISEDAVVRTTHQSRQGPVAAMEPATAQRFIAALSDAMQEMASAGHQPVLLTSPEARRSIRRMTERTLPSLVVISTGEIAAGVRVKNLKVVSLEDAYQKI